jgi:urease accessory protein
MLVIEQVIGNRYDDQQLAEDCQRAAESDGLEHIHLSLDEAVRGRMRVTTDGGTEVGIAVGRDHALRDGDVLYRSDDGQRVVVVTMRAAETLVIRIQPGGSPQDMFELGVRLGHLLGNQHWTLRVAGDRVLVPVTVDRRVMETVLRSHGIEGLEFEVVADG